MIFTNFSQAINHDLHNFSETPPSETLSHTTLDAQYIYNLSKKLSDIIFEYDEKNGEIAKGRAYGTKGEHKAADILAENMSKLGLQVTRQPLKPRWSNDWLTSNVDVLNYSLTLHHFNNTKIVDSAPRIMKTDYRTISDLRRRESLDIILHNMPIKTEHPPNNTENEEYVLLKEVTIKDYTYNGRSYLEVLIKLLGIKYPFEFPQPSEQHPYCKAQILYDTNYDEHDMNYFGTMDDPIFYINRTVAEEIRRDIDQYTVDICLKQELNESVKSENIIGQLKGNCSSKTIIVCSLYDSWWCQGTGDSAIGMSMVVGVAKYFMDHNITPQYNIKFIGFSGEECGCKGALYYYHTHKNENIAYVIDLNQICFTQLFPKMRLEICGNEKKFLDEIWDVVKRTDYEKKMNYTVGLAKVFSQAGHLSNDAIFAVHRPPFLPFRDCKTICVLKNGQWLYHHRDGLNHTAGDVMEYFNWDDVNATGEIVLNITKHVANLLDDEKDRALVSQSLSEEWERIGEPLEEPLKELLK